MSSHILMGVGREIRSVPDDAFMKSVEGLPNRMTTRLAFMSHDHHTVRDFVVRELPRRAGALSPTQIAHGTSLTLKRVTI
jgi:hypothetical protein